MREAIGIFGIVAGVIVVALVGRYGFVTSDTTVDGAIAAFFFAVIAVGGIGGPAVAVHVFRTASGWAKLWGLVAGIIAVVALAANLSNSLGAIAGRADRTIAERSNASNAVKDARAELVRLTKERETLPTFTPSTADDVIAAKAAVTAAERARAAECGDGEPKQRGPRCLQREGEERIKREALAAILANKGLADRAVKIDVDAAAERRKLEKVPPVASVNPMAETLARILHMEAVDAATWQQVATVVVVELLIGFALIAWELLTPTRQSEAKPESVPVVAPPANEALPVARAIIVAQVPVIAGPDPNDTGVETFMLACVKRAKGATVTWAELYVRYRRWCEDQTPALALADPKTFGGKLDKLRSEGIIRTRAKGQDVYCLDVRLIA